MIAQQKVLHRAQMTEMEGIMETKAVALVKTREDAMQAFMKAEMLRQEQELVKFMQQKEKERDELLQQKQLEIEEEKQQEIRSIRLQSQREMASLEQRVRELQVSVSAPS